MSPSLKWILLTTFIFLECVRHAPSEGSIPLVHPHGVDLYLLFDASYAIRSSNFLKTQRFAQKLVQEIGVTSRRNSLRVGAISMSTHAEISFHTTAFQSTEEVIKYGIDRISILGGYPNIDQALRWVQEVMIPLSLERNGTYKAVFIITDGTTYHHSPVPRARALKEHGVKIYCLGISRNANRRGLRAIASQPYGSHVFFMADYEDLQQLVAAVTNQTNQTIDYSECGISQNTAKRARVVGGNDANPGAWPWQALLTITKGGLPYNCGGVLIDRRWVLTAAHCLEDNPDTVEVGLGITDKTRGNHEFITVDEWIIHPHYDDHTFQNDIALLKLERPVVFNANVRPVCVPIKERASTLIPSNPRGQSAVVTGWGHTEQRGAGEHVALEPANVLQQLGLPLKSREDCEESLHGDPEEEFFDESMFCAGFEGAAFGACVGDAGGPLVKKAARGQQRRWIVIGLVSWGRGCAVQGELDFFTNVPYFMDWITETMNSPQQ